MPPQVPRSGHHPPGSGAELTVNLAEAPVPGQLWDPGAQLEVEWGSVGGQVLVRGTQEKARALVWLTAQASRCGGQLGGVVIDLQDLNGQGPGGRAGRGGCRQKSWWASYLPEPLPTLSSLS